MARIVVIDDDDLARFALRKVLTRAGHDVLEAGDGDQGLQICRDASADLVVTDLIMPNQDGLEIIGALRQVDPELQIIAISGGGRLENGAFFELAELEGANKVLQKPFGNAELIEAIQSCLAEA